MSDNTDGAIVGLIPADADPITAASSEPAHMTMVWFGSAADLTPEDVAALRAEVADYAASASGPIHADVKERGTLGDDDADVVFLEGDGIHAYRDGLAALPTVSEVAGRVEQHPKWLPHVTLGYPDTPANEDYSGESVEFDRLSLWVGGEQEHFPLGGETENDMDKEVEADTRVPWYGVLAPTEVMSGDNRIFSAGGISFRDFPLPLKGMRKDLPGHDESVVVANITNAWEDPADGLIKGEGFFVSNEDAEYFIALREQEAMRGISVDLDMAESQTEDENGNPVDLFDPNFDFDTKLVERVTKGRVASATICAIPAFQEAFFNLGTWADAAPKLPIAPPADEEEKPDCSCDEADDNYDPECECPDEEDIVDQPDAPPMFAAGGWAAPAVMLSMPMTMPEVESRHYEMEETMSPAYTMVDVQTALVAAAGAPPRSWFENPALEQLTPLTVTDDGRVFGHAAGWGTCHIGMGKCVTAPKSPSKYAYFHTGELLTSDGPIPVGNITMSTGHANLSLSANNTVAHYDQTGMVVADVVAGEDKYGIWIAGQVRPHLTEKELREFRAAAVSGDWREIGGQQEFVAALAVNVPGFPIPRTAIAASGTKVTAMVAAAIVLDDEREHDQDESILALVKAAVREVRAEDKRVARAGEIRAGLNEERRAEVLAALGEDE